MSIVDGGESRKRGKYSGTGRRNEGISSAAAPAIVPACRPRFIILTWRVDQRDLGGDDQSYSYLAEVQYNTEHFWAYRWYEGHYV